jgi:23S rRNA (cytosine1962-C5)-methyltransferase
MTLQLTSPAWQDYTLLDSGGERKLERFGPYHLIRPEPRAIWKPVAPPEDWHAAHAEYLPAEMGGGGEWHFRQTLPDRWPLQYRNLKMWAAIEDSRQVGIFPENAAHWDWIEDRVRAAEPGCEVLNLFGYTGLASLAAARTGAVVTHIDSSRRAITLGRENQALNDLNDRPIRWIVEDAARFAEREVRRGRRYHGLILDPPKYGLGPNRERWAFSENFDHLCTILRDCLTEQPAFIVVTAYALESPPEILRPGMEILTRGLGGRLELGTLTALERSAGRKIDLSITARWSA